MPRFQSQGFRIHIFHMMWEEEPPVLRLEGTPDFHSEGPLSHR